MKEVTNWLDVSFIKSSSYRKKVIDILSKKEKQPSELAKETKINITHITRALRELEGKNMVKCLTPEVTKGKLYAITDYGTKILSKIS